MAEYVFEEPVLSPRSQLAVDEETERNRRKSVELAYQAADLAQRLINRATAVKAMDSERDERLKEPVLNYEDVNVLEETERSRRLSVELGREAALIGASKLSAAEARESFEIEQARRFYSDYVAKDAAAEAARKLAVKAADEAMEIEKTRRIYLELGHEASEIGERLMHGKEALHLMDLEYERRTTEEQKLSPEVHEFLDTLKYELESFVPAWEKSMKDYHEGEKREMTRQSRVWEDVKEWIDMERAARVSDFFDEKMQIALVSSTYGENKDRVMVDLRRRFSSKITTELEETERYNRIFEAVAFDAANKALSLAANKEILEEQYRITYSSLLSDNVALAIEECDRRSSLRRTRDLEEMERTSRLMAVVRSDFLNSLEKERSIYTAIELEETERSRRLREIAFSDLSLAVESREALRLVREAEEIERAERETNDDFYAAPEEVMDEFFETLEVVTRRLNIESAKRMEDAERLRRIAEEDAILAEEELAHSFARSFAIEAEETERFRRMMFDVALDAAEKAASKENLRLTKALEEEERFRRIFDGINFEIANLGYRMQLPSTQELEEEERRLRIETGYMVPTELRRIFLP